MVENELEKEIKVDLLPHICSAFTYNKSIYPMIDNIYQENKELFDKYAKASEYYNSLVILQGTPMQIVYSRKILGILTALINTTSQDECLALYKKIDELAKNAFPYQYQYVKSCPKFSLSKYLKKVASFSNGELSWEEMINYFIHGFSVLFCCHLLKKEVIEDNAYSRLIRHLYEYNKCISDDDFIKIECIKEKYAKEGEDLKVKIENSKPNFKKCDFFMQEEEFLDILFNKMCDIEDIPIIEILKDTMTQDLVDEIYSYVYSIRECYGKSNNTKEGIEEAADNVISMIYFRAMLREYNKLRDFYLENTDAIYEKQKLQEQVAALTEEIKKLNEERDTFLTQQRQLSNEISKLKNEISKYKNDLQELYKLREVMFKENIEEDVEEENQQTEDINTDLLKDKKIVVLGGYKNWVNELKNFLSDKSIFIEAGRLNYDGNTVFANADLAVFNTKCLCHSVYYKAINEVKKYKIPFVYINNNNIKQTLIKITSNL